MKNNKTFSTMLYLAFFCQICITNTSTMALHNFFDFALPFSHATKDLIVHDMRDEQTPQIIVTLRKDDCVLAIDFKNKAITNKDITIKPTTESVDISSKQSSGYMVSVSLKNIRSQCYIAYSIEKMKKESDKESSEEMHFANSGSRTLDQIIDFEKAGDAELQNGVLSLTLPYKKAKELTINIK
jgi:hypothetical protein